MLKFAKKHFLNCFFGKLCIKIIIIVNGKNYNGAYINYMFIIKFPSIIF